MYKIFMIFMILININISKLAKEAKISDKLLVEIDFGKNNKKTFELGLFEDTPKTSNNFKYLCSGDNTNIKEADLVDKSTKKALVGSIFHRIIPNFMVQGGDFTNYDGTGGKSIYGDKFEDENFEIEHDVGVLSMANAGPNTNGSQFFITTVDTPWLNGRHVVFGRVLSGFEVVKEIESHGTSSGQPDEKIKISNCTLLN